MTLLIYFFAALNINLPFMFTLSALLKPCSGTEYRLLALLGLSVFITNSYLSFILLNVTEGQAFLLCLQPLAIYSIGPTVWLVVKHTLNADFRIQKPHALLYMPGALVSAGFSYMVMTGDLHPIMIPSPDSLGFYPFVLGFLYTIVFVSMAARMLLKRYQQDSQPSEGQSLRRIFLIACAGGLVVLLVSLAGLMFSNQLTIILPLMLTTLVLLGLFITDVRFPSLFHDIRDAIEKAPYRRTLLDQSVADEVGSRLTVLMEEEERFRTNDLTLARLAEEVGISTHQMSEYLNLHLGQGFAKYLNGHRIRAAQKTLREEPDKPVLDIALEVGFRSKSTFNSAFSTVTGTTPTAWRKQEDTSD